MEGVSNQEALKKEYGIENAKTNEEVLKELREEFSDINEFLGNINMVTQGGKEMQSNSKYEKPLDVLDLFNSTLEKINNLIIEEAISTKNKEDKKEVIEHLLLSFRLKMLQAVLVYNGDKDIVDNNGIFDKSLTKI